MKKIFFIVILIGLINISGCGLFSGSGGGNERPIVGNGLEINLRLDTSWINLREVGYEVTIKNTGDKPIVLDESTLFLRESIILNEGNTIISSDSRDEFYKNVLPEGGRLNLNPASSKKFVGIFEISENFYLNPANENFELELKAMYDFKTEFSNNLRINFDNKEFRVTDRISQAAPIEVKRIELVPRLNNQFSIKYTIEDTGPSRNRQDKNIEINNLELMYSSSTLSCENYAEINGENRPINDLMLSQTNRKIVLLCPISLNQHEIEGSVNTITEGSFDYTYIVYSSATVNLPNTRGDRI